MADAQLIESLTLATSVSMEWAGNKPVVLGLWKCNSCLFTKFKKLC